MFGIKFITVDPSTYLIKSCNGKVLKEGYGLSFFYHAPSTSLASVPMGSEDIPFMFSELTGDFQEVTVQGQVTYKIVDVQAITRMLNYILNARGKYISEDPKKLAKRIVNMVQVSLRKDLEKLNLKEAISSGEKIAGTIQAELIESSALEKLGVEVIGFFILGIKLNKETARVLEAGIREVLLKQADDALYLRRNSAIEQERKGVKDVNFCK